MSARSVAKFLRRAQNIEPMDIRARNVSIPPQTTVLIDVIPEKSARKRSTSTGNSTDDMQPAVTKGSYAKKTPKTGSRKRDQNAGLMGSKNHRHYPYSSHSIITQLPLGSNARTFPFACHSSLVSSPVRGHRVAARHACHQGNAWPQAVWSACEDTNGDDSGNRDKPGEQCCSLSDFWPAMLSFRPPTSRILVSPDGGLRVAARRFARCRGFRCCCAPRLAC